MPAQSRFLKVALVISIVIVLNLFFNYAMSLVYKQPVYDTFCPNSQVINPVTTKEECLKVGGQWDESYYPAPAVKTVPGTAVVQQGSCNQYYTCENNFESAQKVYERNVFLTLVILGAIVLIIGLFMRNNMVIANALSYAGVLSFIIASGRYWSAADDIVKVVILALALIALIGVGMKKFNEKQ